MVDAKQTRAVPCTTCNGLMPKLDAHEIDAYECGNCDDIYESEEEANVCCSDDFNEDDEEEVQ